LHGDYALGNIEADRFFKFANQSTVTVRLAAHRACAFKDGEGSEAAANPAKTRQRLAVWPVRTRSFFELGRAENVRICRSDSELF
jgi:hypothetical protein